jgi:hypothetical protein
MPRSTGQWNYRACRKNAISRLEFFLQPAYVANHPAHRIFIKTNLDNHLQAEQ